MDNDQSNQDSARAHIGLFGSVMGYGLFRNYPMLVEVELAVLDDLGYSDFDRKNFFGYSIYTDGQDENTLRKLDNNNPFSARNAQGTTYVSGSPNLSTYGIGLHVFGSYNDISQKANILADGTAAAGIRIDGTVNHLTIAPDVTVTANGERGAAVLVAFGSDHVINHRGTISATGQNAVGIRIDFGMTGGSTSVNSGQSGGTNVAHSYFATGWTSTSPQFNLAKNTLLKGAAAKTVNITGSITANTTSPRSAAIYIGPGAHVETINFMRPDGGTTPTITGHIISDYDLVTDSSPLKPTVLNFGYKSDSDGGATSINDSGFDMDIYGKILGYDYDWSGDSETYKVYQYSQNDTFLGRGIFNLNFVGGVTTVHNDVWVNTLKVDAQGTLKIAGGAFITKADSNRLQNNGKIVFDIESSNPLTFGNVIYGSGQVEKTGSGNLTVTAYQTFTGSALLNDGTLTLTSAAYLPNLTVNTSGILAGVGTIGSLTVTGGGLSPAGTLTYGTLTVNNALTLNNATIYVDLSSQPSYDLVAYTGNISALTMSSSSPNKVNLYNWLAGDYKLLSVGSDITSSFTDIDDYFTEVF
ncbi:MAG: hypothetical protein LBE31_07650, partial [Deltaproteobacteria bacterium]|nr:hypothetical protein [Deltaproteobacteria bacterium]